MPKQLEELQQEVQDSVIFVANHIQKMIEEDWQIGLAFLKEYRVTFWLDKSEGNTEKATIRCSVELPENKKGMTFQELFIGKN